MEATTNNKENNMNTITQGTAHGVTWTKTPGSCLINGFTTIVVDGKEVTFHGHTSNARAFNYIAKMTAKRGVTVVNGQIITKASK
jgi:uncharacterized Zn-binding protein involved in type VI secretion